VGKELSGGFGMKILIISAARSDEGIYLPVFKELDKHPEIEYTIDNELYNHPNWDWVVVLGDTWPMLEATIKAVNSNIPVAHIHGGDLTGSIDESIRHAITRFTHLHFPALPKHAERLIKMGEEPWRITTVGPLGIYAMPEASFISEDKLKKELKLDERPIILVIQHPVSTEVNEAGQQMRETLEVVNNPDWQPVVIYPNGEPGSREMLKVINEYPYRSFRNLPYLTFLSLLKISSCIVGNSSCGLVEAPLFGIPTIDIGNRQQGRTKGNSVTWVNNNAIMFIKGAVSAYIKKPLSCYMDEPVYNPYSGFTNGPEILVNKLKSTPIDKRLLQKRLTY
jgi:UDP-hydrolysing UDP-N-acetyl-D-glucosamine 2-epimerase